MEAEAVALESIVCTSPGLSANSASQSAGMDGKRRYADEDDDFIADIWN